MSKLRAIKEFFDFMLSRRNFWLVPIIILLLLLGTLIILTEGSIIAPFIYTLF